MRRIHIMLVAVLALAAGVALWHGRCGGRPSPAVSASERSLPVEIALANRTLCVTGFPVRFCEHQSASSRGTAPYVVALADGASKVEAIKAVHRCGARVIGPLPPNALIVETSVFSLAKISTNACFAAASEWMPDDKVDTRLKLLIASGGEAIDVTVVALAAQDVDPLVAHIVSQGGEKVKGCLNGKSSVTLKLPRELVAALAKRGDVRWLEPFVRPKLLNDAAVGPTTMNVREVWNAHGLTGRGQVVTTSDSGIDTGDLATMHADLRNQLIGFKVADEYYCYAYDADGHGTHTAGSIVGDGTMSDGQIRGTAYGAKLWAWFCGGWDEYIYTPETCEELFRPSDATNACVHSASWGSDDAGAYGSQSRDMDEYVWEHPDFLPVIANGNAGSSAQTVGSPATAKNVLSVGAAQNARSDGDGGWGNGDPTKIASFSSRGPCKDGRIKPDLCAPGVGIASTRAYGCSYAYGICSNTNYAYDSGTSMATPLTAGAAALVRQWLVENRGFTNAPPTAALVKAVLTGGAKGVTAPNNDFGWGRVDVGESLYPSNRAVRLLDRISYSSGSARTFSVTLTNAAPFDAQLVWIDYPATEGAAKMLVNDLDLVVSNRQTGAVWYGNGTDGGDHMNNVESIRIAEATTGEYAVIVRGYDVSYDSDQGGAAALYLRGAFEEADECESLVISQATPSSTTVSLTAGESVEFSVSVTTSKGVEVSYGWTLDGTNVSAATSNSFAWTAGPSDRGLHSVTVTASSPSGLSDAHSWTVAVSGEIAVDAAKGDDATATGEAERPYATIPAALASALAGDTLRVAPGTYAGGLAASATQVRIESTGGPAATFLDGGGTSRCYDGSANADTVLSGFTLTNGWIDASYSHEYGAGAYGGTLTNCIIVDCHIIDDGSYYGYGYGGGAAYATLIDCRIENCSAVYAGGGIYNCTASYCVLSGNSAAYYSNSYGGGAAESTLTHCTVYDNVGGGSAGGVDCACTCNDTIVWGNTLDSGTESNWELYVEYNPRGQPVYSSATYFSYSCTTPAGYSDGGGNTTVAPRWVAPEKGDFRLAVKSPCLGTASDGTNMGAWQGEGVPGYILTATAVGSGTVEPASAFVTEGGSATFTMSEHHRLAALATNGVDVAVSNEYVWRDVREDGELTATFAPTNFYVDAESGDDASNGWSRAEAKRTIQAAVDVAGDGETVWVNPGVYTGEVMATKAQIDIVAVEGPDVTTILGGETNRCYEGYYNAATRLVGFALEGGNSTNNYGGGVFMGTLSNCVIRNCYAAWGGGGVYEATLYGCVITNCTSDYGGGAYDSTLVGTVIANCESSHAGGGAYDSTLENCTVRGCRAKALRRSDFNTAGGGVDSQCSCVNTILRGNVGPSGGEDNWELRTSTRFHPWYGYYTQTNNAPSFYWCCTVPYNSYSANSITDDPRFVSTNDLGDARLYDISPCIGKGQSGANIGAYAGAGIAFPLPEVSSNASPEAVSNAVASVPYADASVAAGIGTNAVTYNQFSTWTTNGLTSKRVIESTRAWDSFLVREIVAAPTLLGEGNETKVELTALEPASDGTCSTTVRLVDGESEIPLCSVKAAFAKHSLVGDEVNALSTAKEENVAAEALDGGRAVKLTLTPPLSTSRYFMRFDIR